MEAVSCEKFSMSYGEGKFSLRDIDLSIEEGDFVVLTGGTGSGKSTLLRQLKREFVSSDYLGSIKVHGKEVRDMTRQDTLKVGYVMQSPSEQIVTDKVFHELSFALENMGLSSDEIRLRVSETAHYFGLSDYMDRSTFELSGGEMQVLNIASIMAMRPDILLLDEPTSQLDEVTAEKLLSLVYRINRELGTTVIIAEHRLDMLDRFTSLIIMDKGSIVYNGKEPRGYNELPIYMRIGEIMGKKCSNIVECRALLKDSISSVHRISGDNACSDGNTSTNSSQKCVNARDKDKKIVLSAHDLWYRYNRDGKDILKGLDLDVYQGEILGIIGANGVGKSTLLSILAGARECYKGKVKNYDNKVIYIAQNPCFAEDTLGEELTSAIGHYLDVYRKDVKKSNNRQELVKLREENLKKMREDYLDIWGLKNLENMPINKISGGEKAKLGILIGLLSSPDVLLLDEPTKGLDRDGKMVVVDALRELVALKKSVILVSHDIELVSCVSDRIGTLFDGEILSICTPNLLLRSNYLYTTTTSRITRGIIDDVVLEDDLINVVSEYAQ